jgi:hypothetical protein
VQGSRSLVFIAGGIVAILVVAVVVVLLAGGRGPQQFPAGSPEAAIQAYLATWEEGDLDAAYEFFSSEVRDRFTLEEFERAADDYRQFQAPEGTARQAFIDEVDGTGDHVTVHVTVEELYGEGLSTQSYRSTRELRMVREAGSGWKFDQPLVWLDPSGSGFFTP